MSKIPLFNDPALMRVTLTRLRDASQLVDGSPPQYGTAVAPGSTAFHTSRLVGGSLCELCRDMLPHRLVLSSPRSWGVLLIVGCG